VDKYWGEMRKQNQEEGSMAPGNDLVQLHFQPITKIHLDTSINFSQEQVSNPQILDVIGTNASFNQGWEVNSFKHEGAERSTFVYRVVYDYLDVLGIKLQAGRNFSRWPVD
jgi:hypothetical protein